MYKHTRTHTQYSRPTVARPRVSSFLSGITGGSLVVSHSYKPGSRVGSGQYSYVVYDNYSAPPLNQVICLTERKVLLGGEKTKNVFLQSFEGRGCIETKTEENINVWYFV